MRIRAKFREDQPIRCCDIAIFVVFKLLPLDVIIIDDG